MSDAFDDMADLFEANDYDYAASDFNYNPLYYHMELEYVEVKRTSEKFISVVIVAENYMATEFEELTVAIPKKIIRNWNPANKTMWVHKKIFFERLESRVKEEQHVRRFCGH